MPKPVIFDDAGRARVTKTVGKKLAKADVIVIEDDEEPKSTRAPITGRPIEDLEA